MGKPVNQDLKVKPIDGAYMRTHFDPQATEGSNDRAFPEWVPPKTIVIEKGQKPIDRFCVTAHEVVERGDMEAHPGKVYQTAHTRAVKVENRLRELLTGVKPVMSEKDELKHAFLKEFVLTKLSQAAKPPTSSFDILKGYEGGGTGVYKDHLGNPTLPGGVKVDANSNKVIAGYGKPPDKALYANMAQARHNKAVAYARKTYPNLPGPAQETLGRVVYQLGQGGWGKFKNTQAAIQAHIANPSAATADAVKTNMLDSAWAKQTPRRAQEESERLRSQLSGMVQPPSTTATAAPVPAELPPKQGQAAEGIPDRAVMSDPGQLKPSAMAGYVLGEHKATRAGLHHDLRIEGADGALHSWALPKGLPGPGKRHLAVIQPAHGKDAGEFEGEIPAGEYGAGKVRIADKGKALIVDSKPGKIDFVLASKRHPQAYTMVKTKGNNWIILNTSAGKAEREFVEANPKEHYAEARPEQLDDYLGTHAIAAKIDGALATIRTKKNSARLFSPRISKQTGAPLEYTHYVGGMRDLKLPKDFQDATLRGEVYGERAGKAIPNQELSGILNSTLENALSKQKTNQIKLKVALFNVIKSRRLNAEDPYLMRAKGLGELVSRLKDSPFTTPPMEVDPKAARRLFEDIRAGRHPLTHEGVVAFPETGVPTKIKPAGEADVIIKRVFPAETKGGKPRAGGFAYALPESPDREAGRVGSGFSHDTLRDMLADPEKYVGRTARIEMQEQFPSGAYRGPRFHSLHEDIPELDKSATVTNMIARPMGATVIQAARHPKLDALIAAFRNRAAGVSALDIHKAWAESQQFRPSLFKTPAIQA